jgi:hypothetical protein
MSLDASRDLFNKIDADGDGKIDPNEFSQWAGGGPSGGVTSSSSKIIKGDYSTGSYGGGDIRTGASYGNDTSFGASGSATFDRMDLNRDNVIDRSEFNQFTRSGPSGGVTSTSSKIIKGDYSTGSYGGGDIRTGASYVNDTSVGASGSATFDRMHLNRDNVIDRSEFNQFTSGGSSADYVSIYRTDSRGFFLDPNPEIITRIDPGPAPTYTQKITIRYLQPPPLPPMGVSYFFSILLFVLLIKN